MLEVYVKIGPVIGIENWKFGELKLFDRILLWLSEISLSFLAGKVLFPTTDPLRTLLFRIDMFLFLPYISPVVLFTPFLFRPF